MPETPSPAWNARPTTPDPLVVALPITLAPDVLSPRIASPAPAMPQIAGRPFSAFEISAFSP